jgi:hypothetical protein
MSILYIDMSIFVLWDCLLLNPKLDLNNPAHRTLVELYAVGTASVESQATRTGSDPLHTGQESPHRGSSPSSIPVLYAPRYRHVIEEAQ